MKRLHAPQPFEELDHTADAGVVVRGDSASETLARLILAQAAVLSGGAPVLPDHELVLEIPPGPEVDMAIDVLRELLYRFCCDRVIPESVVVDRFDTSGCRVRVTVGPWSPELHADGIELKAVTLHEARFERVDGGWEASVVFDV